MKIQKITKDYIAIILLFGILYGSNSSHGELGTSMGGRRTRTPSGTADNELEEQKVRFKQNVKLLSQEAQNVIIEKCGHWNEAQNWENWLKRCEQQVTHSRHLELMYLKADFRDQETWAQVFPEEDNPDLPPLSQSMNNHIEKIASIYREYRTQMTVGGRRDAGQDGDNSASVREFNILKHSEGIAFLEKMGDPPFLGTRKEFLGYYGCDEEPGGASPIRNCYNNIVAQQFPKDKKCIDEHGFKKCRPFLAKGGCDPKAVVALDSELSQEDKTGMTYICWKAATQGAQCCMNPDQCPTDGAFRGIASQLKKAAPGIVQAFAGLEAIKGNYQKACEANLLANAAGPLGQLKTKTCGDSVDACEKTCDKAVQDFKENFKQAVMGQQSLSPRRQGTGQGQEEEKPITIDEIVNAAKLIEEEDLKIAKEDVETCSKAVVYLDNLFKDKEKNKKSKSLSEKLSHASLVDCSGEVFQYSGGGNPGGGAGPRMPGMNPMAAQMCRQGNPSGPQGPRFPVVGPTPNPRTNQAFLTGGKTIAPGGDFTAPGTPGAPPDEFIEPERGPAGSGALQGGWTDTGGSGMGPGGGGPGGGGLTGSPSRDGEGGNGGTGDNLPMAYPEGFDMGSGGLDGSGGNLSSEDAERLRMAQYMEKKDKEEERKKEEERLRRVDAQGSIFSRISRTIREWCEEEGCSEE